MEQLQCTYDPFAFSPRTRALRQLVLLAAHPLLWTVPVVLLFGGILNPTAARSDTVAAAFLAAFFLILLHRLQPIALQLLDTLARKDAKAPRLRDPREYYRTRHNTNGGTVMKQTHRITRLTAAASLAVILLSLCACAEAPSTPIQPDSFSAAQEALPHNPATDVDLLRPAPCLVEELGPVTASDGIPAMTRSRYNVGSCRQLKGKPYVLVIFLDDDVSSWDEQGVKTYWNNLVKPALTFMEENAASWDAELDFQYGCYATFAQPDRPVKYDGVIKTFIEGETSKDILEQAAAALGYASKERMHEHMMEISGQDQVAYVVMLNKGGRSYSSCYANSSPNTTLTGSPENYYLEHSVIYTGFTDTSGDSASDTVAHEMLHLFGAEDYYYPENREALANRVYPKDIMLCAMTDLQYFNLGDFTAYTVGWTDYTPTVCLDPAWW